MYVAMDYYNAFLVLVKTNYKRIFGFFIPERFKLKLPSRVGPKKEKQ